MKIDPNTKLGPRVAHRLEQEQVIWLTTVDRDQTPQPSPVWFVWDGDTVLIYSQPAAPKVRNIGRSPRVSLSFNSTVHGGDYAILTGDAWIDDNGPAASAVPAYIEKYSDGLASINLTPDAFARDYAAVIRVRPTALRGDA